ncbi:MAG: twin-arginine translocation signal domain-containing protein, partial [Siphonobacter aquaeclarae]|nr:twin-arginine translocation signal domain-containing protein [Siphonobacter aquaeclarae]
MNKDFQSRRDFVKAGSLLAGGLIAAPLASNAGSLFNSAVADEIKIALVG